VVIPGDEERVSVKEGPHIEEREADIVVKDHVRGLIAGDDPAEQAGFRQRS
jgi:hypothetical protein